MNNHIIMATNEEVIDEEIDEEASESESESVDWETRARKLEEKAIQQRERTRLLRQELERVKKSVSQKDVSNTEVTKKSNELDYGEKAFLTSKGYGDVDEMKIALEFRNRTGDSLEDIMQDEIFIGKIANLRDQKIVKAAIPEGTKRSQSYSSRDSVEYWVAKGELPPRDKVQLRRDVVNARIKTEKSASRFSDIGLIQ